MKKDLAVFICFAVSIFLSIPEWLYAQEGTVLWHLGGSSGIPTRGSPAIGGDGTVYFGRGMGFYAINPDGTVRWTLDTMSKMDFTYSSPAIGVDGYVYVGTVRTDSYATLPDVLLAIEADDPRVRWGYDTRSGGIESCPAIGADGTVYVGTRGGSFHAINPDGTLRWRFNASGWDIHSSPAIGADGAIYFGSDDGCLYAINPNGTKRWRFQTGGEVMSSPAIAADGTIYVGSFDHYLYAIKSDGTLRWRYETNGDVESSPAIGSDGTIYVGSGDGCLHAINPNGTKRWTKSTGGWISSSPAIGADGIIYIGSNDWSFYAFNPDGALRWKVDTEYAFMSSPVIAADGTIYVGTEADFYAITSSSRGLADSPWPMFGRDVRHTRNASQIGVFIIQATANPAEGGTVNGGGSYNYNALVTLTAVPKQGYMLSHWTENGQVIPGARAIYTFQATAGRNLVAHFREISPLPGVLMLLMDER